MASSFPAATAKLLRQAPPPAEALSDLAPLKIICGSPDLSRPAMLAAALRAAATRFQIPAVAAGEQLLLAPICTEPDVHCLDSLRAARNVAAEINSKRVFFPGISMADIIQGVRKLGRPRNVFPGLTPSKLLFSQDAYHLLGVSAVAVGMIMLAAGETNEPNDSLAGQPTDVINELKEQLGSLSEKASQLETENQQLRQDTDKAS